MGGNKPRMRNWEKISENCAKQKIPVIHQAWHSLAGPQTGTPKHEAYNVTKKMRNLEN